jgi:hypothetical protein
MDENDMTVGKKLDKLLENMEKMQEKKGFKLRGARLSMARMKKNYALVFVLKTNGGMEIKKIPIEDNTIKIGDIYYEATARNVFRYKKYPVVIVPEWNITPLAKPEDIAFDPEKNFKEAVDEGKLSAAEKFILHAIKMDLVSGKKKMSWTTVLIVLGAIGGLLLLLNYLKVI